MEFEAVPWPLTDRPPKSEVRNGEIDTKCVKAEKTISEKVPRIGDQIPETMVFGGPHLTLGSRDPPAPAPDAGAHTASLSEEFGLVLD